MAPRIGLHELLATLVLAAGAAQAQVIDSPAPDASARPASEGDTALDEEFLEFLGSVDSEDGEWNDYLEDAELGDAAEKTAPRAETGLKP